MQSADIMEEWKWIEGFEGIYAVSSQGRLRSYQQSRKRPHVPHFLQPRFNNRGYLTLTLYKNGRHYARKVHRLVAAAFVPTSNPLLHINHIDAVKTNNGSANLEWVTAEHNYRLALALGLMKRKPHTLRNSQGHLTKEALIDMRALFRQGLTRKEIAIALKLPVSTVQHALRGETVLT